MSEFTDYLEKALLDVAFAEVAFTAPTSHYLRLLSTAPTDALDLSSQLVEISGGGYAAAAIGFDAATGTSPSTSDNTATVSFTNTTTTNWVIRAIAITNGSGNAKNVLCYTPITTATIGQNEKIQFDPGDIDITLD